MFSFSKVSKIFFASVIIICTALGTASAKEGDDFFFTGNVGVGVGGDQLVHIGYSDGTTENIDGGDGDFINIGFFIKPFFNKNLETQLTAGLNEYRSEATNGTITWSRNSIDLIQFYRFEGFRIGLGATYHFDVRIEGTGVADSIDADGEDAIGFVSEIDWFLGKRDVCEVYLGLKFTNIDYDFNGSIYNGDSLAFLFGIYF